MTMPLTKRPIRGIATAILILIGAIVLYSLSPFHIRFDSRQWQTCSSHGTRYAMKDDLLRNHKLVGLSKSELISQLGPPDVGRDETSLEWEMGSVPGHDDNTLIVRLQDNKVISVEVSSM